MQFNILALGLKLEICYIYMGILDSMVMKRCTAAVVAFVGGCALLHAQSDLPVTRPLNIGERNPLDISANPSGTLLRMPSVLDESLMDKDADTGVKMLPDRELLQAGHDLELDPKVGERKGKGGTYFGDQYLGDIKTTAQFVRIVCRDYGDVDGDRIKIYLNGEVIKFNILLAATFEEIKVDLVQGFNHIEFEALNQGSLGPNTAQVMVTNDKGEVIHNNRWKLSTGSKASLILVKEE